MSTSAYLGGDTVLYCDHRMEVQNAGVPDQLDQFAFTNDGFILEDADHAILHDDQPRETVPHDHPDHPPPDPLHPGHDHQLEYGLLIPPFPQADQNPPAGQSIIPPHESVPDTYILYHPVFSIKVALTIRLL